MGLFDSMSANVGTYQEKTRQKAKAKSRKRKGPTPEKKLEKQILKHFKKDYMVIQHNSLMQFSEQTGTPLRAYSIANTGAGSGLADITIARDGKLLYMELKTGYNKQTESQKKFEATCEEFGMPYVVVYSLEEAIEKVNSFFNN